VSANTKYTSSHIIDEMVEVIGQILDDQLVAEMSKSPVWGLMVDETTDISVTKQLGLVVRTVGTIFWFYQASSNRTSSLKDMERLFELPQIKLQVTVLKLSLAQLKESNMVKDRWQAWLQSDAGLKPLQEEVPAYFQDVWESFKNTVMEPFLTALTENIDNRFPNTGSLSVFSVFSPRQILANSSTEYGDAEMRTLAEQFPRLRESDLLSEWSSYRLRVGSPDLKTKSLEEVLLWLVSAESAELYPTLSLAAAIALTAPVQTADVERLFSALKIVIYD
ncbi:unnamed protein product, partial [Merluccius merluccius]